MAIFFFVVGLEIKRELVSGELREPRAAALPLFGALGGMIVPAGLYLLINAGGEGARGWGVPMATDIAFAAGVLAVVGKSLPGSLRLFLLSLAIVDDIGAILVIALFYSSGISLPALLAAGALLLVIVALQRARVQATAPYVVVGIGVWLAVFESGVHATIAGVVLGLLTPALPFASSEGSGETTGVSPLTRLEQLLHPWTSFAIVPLFALANAGVRLDTESIRNSLSSPVTLGIVAGLVLGKVAGVTAGAWIGTRLKLARLPEGVRWNQMVAVAAVAGVGFTVSLFIADLAFPDPELLEAAKLGVLIASVLAGVLGGGLVMLTKGSSDA